jgi:diguanylate cyclase (GGDEF)-like protein
MVRFTDDEALADLRARYIVVMTTVGAGLSLVARLLGPGAFVDRDRNVWLILLAPLGLAAGVSLLRRGRLTDRSYLACMLLVDGAVGAFVALAQRPGATTCMEIILVLPSMSAAMFCGRRVEVAAHTAVATAVLLGLVWLRTGPDGTAPATGLGETFILVLVTGVVRWLRDAARDSLSRAERGEVTDFLTGLANRRGLERFVTAQWSGHARAGHRLAFLVVDVDHFKRLNDERGHQAGDQMLRRLADLLREHVRETDLVVRLGGEEFLVLARVPPGGARRLAERIRSAIAERLPPVTASVGVLEAAPDPGDPVPDRVWEAVDQADQALYQAKRAGRNRVEIAAG